MIRYLRRWISGKHTFPHPFMLKSQFLFILLVGVSVFGLAVKLSVYMPLTASGLVWFLIAGVVLAVLRSAGLWRISFHSPNRK